MSEPGLVIIDDNEARRKIRRELLERMGLRVLEAATPSMVMACAVRQAPILVLLCGTLPDAETREACRRLKAEAGASFLLCILEGTAESASCVGADIYLREPVEPEELAATVSTCLRWCRRESIQTRSLAVLAHELRNPLAPIRTVVHVLRELGPVDPRLAWAREVMGRQVDHLVRLVDDLLDMSRLAHDKISLKREVLDLADIVEQALEISRPFIQEHCHDLIVCLPGQLLPVSGDRVRLVQIIQNLLNNAAKYTPEGGRLWLQACEENAQAVVRLRDTGTGIAAELLPHVFELFTQGECNLERSQGGLGLGLTIVKRLVELHGGEIEARSEGVGRGSEFIVRLPLSRGSPVSITAGVTALPDPRLLFESAKRVLVVDDNADTVESLALLLELEGHQVKTALDGPTALALAAGFGPEVVFLDIGLPGMNGYDIATALRKAPETSRALLVAITGYGQQEDKRRADAAGFDHYLVKPVDPNEFSGLLARGRKAAC